MTSEAKTKLDEAHRAKSFFARGYGYGADWEWPDSLDVLVAAPAHHFLVFENDCVCVLHT